MKGLILVLFILTVNEYVTEQGYVAASAITSASQSSSIQLLNYEIDTIHRPTTNTGEQSYQQSSINALDSKGTATRTTTATSAFVNDTRDANISTIYDSSRREEAMSVHHGHHHLRRNTAAGLTDTYFLSLSQKQQKQQQHAISSHRNLMSSKGMSGNGMNSDGMSGKGMNSKGMSGKGMNSEGMSGKGMNSKGMSSKGMSNKGMSSKEQSSKGMRSNDSADDSNSKGKGKSDGKVVEVIPTSTKGKGNDMNPIVKEVEKNSKRGSKLVRSSAPNTNPVADKQPQSKPLMTVNIFLQLFDN
jgi:hypothetical protein